MYKVGQASAVPLVERKWTLVGALAIGGIVGDRIAAGRFRPLLILPHKRWRHERAGRVGAMIGSVVGLGAAWLYLKSRGASDVEVAEGMADASSYPGAI